MKTDERSLKAAMDRRLSFLDEMPSCRSAVMHRIAQEEEPGMKKKISYAFVLAAVMVMLFAAALAAGLLLSQKADAARIADQALEKKYGVTAEMMTFFGREEEELENGAVQVTYFGAGELRYVLGTYTAVVRNGQAEISWSHDGEEISGGYDAEAWGLPQLKQMLADGSDEAHKNVYIAIALSIAEANGVTEDNSSSEAEEGYFERLEAEKTAAMEARKLSEDEMFAIGKEFIINTWGISEEQVSRLELFTGRWEEEGNAWYAMVDGEPCFRVEYLETEKENPGTNGYYIIWVNVETGAVEEYDYNSGLGGMG